MTGLQYFFDLMHKGKTVNYIILCLYIITLAVAAERFIYYLTTRYKRKIFNTILTECRTGIGNKEQISDESFQYTAVQKSWIPEIAGIFFEYRSSEALPEALERGVQRIIAAQERGFILLSRIAAAAPLLGLLGTVTGLMAAFQKIAALGSSVDIAVLSGGIWEAMITTATGLVTALFSFTAYEAFDWLNIHRIRDMEQLVSLLTEKNTSHCSASQERRYKGSSDEAV